MHVPHLAHFHAHCYLSSLWDQDIAGKASAATVSIANGLWEGGDGLSTWTKADLLMKVSLDYD